MENNAHLDVSFYFDRDVRSECVAILCGKHAFAGCCSRRRRSVEGRTRAGMPALVRDYKRL